MLNFLRTTTVDVVQQKSPQTLERTLMSSRYFQDILIIGLITNKFYCSNVDIEIEFLAKIVPKV